MDYEVVVRETPPEHLASVRGTYPISQLPEVMPREFDRIMGALRAEGVQPAGGAVAIYHGWTEDTHQNMLEFAARAAELPIAAIIYTDIAKDGMLEGLNIERTKALAEAVDIPVIASGGVKELDDIRKLLPIGVEGVIAGRSLYEGTLDLAEAIQVARAES